MANHRHLPEPTYTPPTEFEVEHGYYLDCPGCGRQWSARFVDRHLNRCIPCARRWRREDMASRRKGLGGVPLTTEPIAHAFESHVLRREVDLNDPATQNLIRSNERFRDEVTAYVDKLVAQNARPKAPLHGVLPLLAKQRARRPVERMDLDDEADQIVPTNEAAAAVDAAVDGVMNTIDGEVVESSRRRR